MVAKRNITRYTLHRKAIGPAFYVGQTARPKARAGEHLRSGKVGIMRKHGPKVSRKTALAWERRTIAGYRRRKGARSLRNRT